MDLRQLEAVVAVVDAGSFSAAADTLGITQPSLSRRIATLEAELGLALFDRVGRGVRLSAAGAAVVDPARRALHEGRHVRAAADAVAGLTGGHLDLAGLPTMVVTHLAPLAGAFHRRHPAVVLTLHGAGDPGELAAMVLSARCDLGIVELPLAAEGLEAVPLGTQELVAVLPPGTDVSASLVDRRTSPPTVAVGAVLAMPLVALPAGTSSRLLVDELYADAGVVPDIAITTDQRDALVPLVLAGAGITFLPERLGVEAAERGAVVVRTRPRTQRQVGLVRRSGPVTPAVAAFVALATSARGGAPRRRRSSAGAR